MSELVPVFSLLSETFLSRPYIGVEVDSGHLRNHERTGGILSMSERVWKLYRWIEILGHLLGGLGVEPSQRFQSFSRLDLAQHGGEQLRSPDVSRPGWPRQGASGGGCS